MTGPALRKALENYGDGGIGDVIEAFYFFEVNQNDWRIVAVYSNDGTHTTLWGTGMFEAYEKERAKFSELPELVV